MKNITISFFTLHFSLFTLSASAAVPLHWTVETTRAQPATFDAYQGETLAFEAALTSRGKPLELSGLAAFYWQTNGMGSAYWESTAAVNSNRLSAVFTPEMDVGAKVYNCFIGVPGTIYHAAFQLRLRPSPGALPNVLPLPVPVIDFAKVRVLNPPWEGGGGGVNTNAVRDIIHDTVDGEARPLPKYLHLYNADDSYPEAAQEYYRSRGNGRVDGGCSSVRSGGFLYRNFDYPFDDRAEFVVRVSAASERFASVGIAQVGTNLTEQMVTSGKPEYSHLYKWLPGATVDGINENGVACNINVVDGDPQTSGWHNDTGDLHPLAAIRWSLDHATNAQHAAEYIAAHIRFPQGWTQNFHYMIADTEKTYIVENGSVHDVTDGVKVLTNFRLYGDPKDTSGEGQERYIALTNGANITSQWWTLTYTANGYRASDLPGITGETLTQLFNYWENNPRESHRGESFGDKVWWQTVHTSIYDLTNRVLRVAVQETDDWYTFQVPASGGTDEAKVRAIASEVVAPVASQVSGLQSSKLDKSDVVAPVPGASGAADANLAGLLIDGLEQSKANRAESGHDGELATLDEDGNPTRSGIAADDVVLLNQSDAQYGDVNLEGSVSAARGFYAEGGGVSVSADIETSSGDVMCSGYDEQGVFKTHRLSEKADRSMISATDPTFSNEVSKVVKTNAYTKAETDAKLSVIEDAVSEADIHAQAAQGAAESAQSTADAALPATHPNASVYGAWDYDSYSGEYGLSIYGTGDSRVWLTPFDVCFDSGGPYSTRISLVWLSDEVSYVYSDYYTLSSELWGHIYNYSGSNPHGVTAWDVGAPTVDEVESMIGEITPEKIGAATQIDIDNSISATQPNFRDQVMAVGFNIDPTAAAEINRILDRGGFESNCTVVVKTVLLHDDNVRRRIIESAKLYWDPGLRVTWQIDVTNGCFYSHIVSDDNLVDHIR